MEPRITVFGPGPVLTVTVESRDGVPDIHLHAGGQGVWQARMIASLGEPVVLCANLGGETGQVLRGLVGGHGVELREATGQARNGAYIHDRRGGERLTIADAGGDPLSRHELDELYNIALVEGLRTRLCALAGPTDQRIVQPEVYRRLASDLSINGVTVLADLSGHLLDAALDGGVQVLKVSHEELVADGRARSDAIADLVTAIETLHRRGVESVVVSRANSPALASVDGVLHEVVAPTLEAVEPRGAGDSMTAGIAVGLSRGWTMADAVRLGAAAGALNVTRSGLGTAEREAAERLAGAVELRPMHEMVGAGAARSPEVVRASPDELAARTGLR